MPELLRMPEIAANTTEAVLLSWPIPENVPFADHATIATVETAKAVVDVEAEFAGVILRTLVAEGSEVSVGDPIALLATAGEHVADIEAALRALGHTSDIKGPLALDVPEADPSPVPASPSESRASVGPAPAFPPPAPTGQSRVFASPLARRLAREAGLSIDDLVGSGPHRRIVRRDVEAAVRAASETSASSTSAGRASATVVPGVDVDPAAYIETLHTRQRRLIATRLTESKQTTPHFYLRGTARVDALLDLRSDINASSRTSVSLNDLIVKAVAGAHLLVPALNVIWTDHAVRQFREVDVAVAIAVPGGLVTPVVRDVGSRSLTAVAASIAELASAARAGRLRQHDLEGGTVTVSNLGMYGVEEFAAIINPPHSSILAVGAARSEPHVRKGRLRVATMMHVTLSVDHRAVDGATAAEWMHAFLELTEHPARILA